MRTWEAHDSALTRPVAAPLEQCAKLLRVEPSRPPGGRPVEPYIRVDGTKVWSLTQLERRLRPNAYGRFAAVTSPVVGFGTRVPCPRARDAARSVDPP